VIKRYFGDDDKNILKQEPFADLRGFCGFLLATLLKSYRKNPTL